ncbi:unnamed protein product [Dicrocoelium dendriticum]|nr:unnamed protein product [Dicrocoelium dendriticum]
MIVDVDATLKSVLESPENATAIELTQDSTSRLSSRAEPKVTYDKSVTLIPVSVSAPEVVKGSGSQDPLFLPNPHGSSRDVKQMMDNIDLDSLRKTWTNLTIVDSVEEHVTVPPSITVNVFSHSVTSSNSAKRDSANILEAVPDTMWNAIGYMPLHEEKSRNLPTSVSKHMQNSLATAFHVNSPGHLCADIAARSSPLIRHVPGLNFSQYTIQVNLTDALAMLDYSTARLDASELMETGDEEKSGERKSTGGPGSNAVVGSVMFSGPRCAVPSHCSKLALQFATTLVLSADFYEALLKFTQMDPSSPIRMPSLTPYSHLCPSDILHGTELSCFRS